LAMIGLVSALSGGRRSGNQPRPLPACDQLLAFLEAL
jgi:hypothetical protein